MTAVTGLNEDLNAGGVPVTRVGDGRTADFASLPTLLLPQMRSAPSLPGEAERVNRPVSGLMAGDVGRWDRAGTASGLALRAAAPPEAAGLGPLAVLVTDPEVTDVLVNGDEVWVDRGLGLQRVRVRLGGPEGVRRLAQRLASGCGRRLDDASPYVDAVLADGTRLHAVLPPVARTGPYLSLRTVRPRAFSLDDLIRAGTLDAQVAQLLSALVAARRAYVVTGGAGSGKTTLLAALLSLVPATERIVIVEDSAELRLQHPHAVTLEARLSNVEGAGEVTLRDLVRQALRMRPDRLVVGECRGGEVIDWLAALNTGHDGGAGTLHANTPADVPARIEALGLLGGLGREALQAQVTAALDVAVHLRRLPTGRVVDEISLLRGSGSRSEVTVVPVWRRGWGTGPGAGDLADALRTRDVKVPRLLHSTPAES